MCKFRGCVNDSFIHSNTLNYRPIYQNIWLDFSFIYAIKSQSSYDITLKCWEMDASKRPTFSELCVLLQNAIEDEEKRANQVTQFKWGTFIVMPFSLSGQAFLCIQYTRLNLDALWFYGNYAKEKEGRNNMQNKTWHEQKNKSHNKEREREREREKHLNVECALHLQSAKPIGGHGG